MIALLGRTDTPVARGTGRLVRSSAAQDGPSHSALPPRKLGVDMPDQTHKQARDASSAPTGGTTQAHPTVPTSTVVQNAGMLAATRIGNDTDDLGKTAQQGFSGLSFRSRTTRAQVIHADDKAKLSCEAGLNFSVSLTPHGIGLRFTPGLLLEVSMAPDLELEFIHYDFATADFRIEGDANFDLLGMYKGHVFDMLKKTLGEKLRPRLPAAMQRAGYDINRDPAFEKTMRELHATVDGLTRPKKRNPAGSLVGQIEMSLSVDMPEELKLPLGEKFEVEIEKGTRIMLTAKTTGAPPHAELSSVRLEFMGQAADIHKTKGALAPLQALDLRSVTIQRGGEMHFDYDLAVEKLASGVKTLLAARKLAAAGVTNMNSEALETRLHGVHAEIDQTVREKLGPRIADLVRKLDGKLPGFSLSTLVQ